MKPLDDVRMAKLSRGICCFNSVLGTMNAAVTARSADWGVAAVWIGFTAFFVVLFSLEDRKIERLEERRRREPNADHHR